MIGGGQIDDAVRSYTGADAFGTNAIEAVSLCKGWLGATA
jgi:5-methyltetrahydrofolate--homocysteine methyltransferase